MDPITDNPVESYITMENDLTLTALYTRFSVAQYKPAQRKQ